mmetsp:Transcript_9576/g.15655  ORF Transcript_9576/g.15655 Transcript_9576/m.15655 type:complete len:95 (+) Transcript_9576:351-635(+)
MKMIMITSRDTITTRAITPIIIRTPEGNGGLTYTPSSMIMISITRRGIMILGLSQAMKKCGKNDKCPQKKKQAITEDLGTAVSELIQLKTSGGM